jgi:hypothetical protein
VARGATAALAGVPQGERALQSQHIDSATLGPSSSAGAIKSNVVEPAGDAPSATPTATARGAGFRARYASDLFVQTDFGMSGLPVVDCPVNSGLVVAGDSADLNCGCQGRTRCSDLSRRGLRVVKELAFQTRSRAPRL